MPISHLRLSIRLYFPPFWVVCQNRRGLRRNQAKLVRFRAKTTVFNHHIGWITTLVVHSNGVYYLLPSTLHYNRVFLASLTPILFTNKKCNWPRKARKPRTNTMRRKSSFFNKPAPSCLSWFFLFACLLAHRLRYRRVAMSRPNAWGTPWFPSRPFPGDGVYYGIE